MSQLIFRLLLVSLILLQICKADEHREEHDGFADGDPDREEDDDDSESRRAKLHQINIALGFDRITAINVDLDQYLEDLKSITKLQKGQTLSILGS